VDPKMLDKKIPYNLSKKSDIYSMGVTFWQLTSCSSPFNFEKRKDHASISLEILNGVREEPIPNTNVKFIELYQRKYKIIIKFHFYNKISNPNLIYLFK
jgi:serine/threonine protein kinase